MQLCIKIILLLFTIPAMYIAVANSCTLYCVDRFTKFIRPKFLLLKNPCEHSKIMVHI